MNSLNRQIAEKQRSKLRGRSTTTIWLTCAPRRPRGRWDRSRRSGPGTWDWCSCRGHIHKRRGRCRSARSSPGRWRSPGSSRRRCPCSWRRRCTSCIHSVHVLVEHGRRLPQSVTSTGVRWHHLHEPHLHRACCWSGHSWSCHTRSISHCKHPLDCPASCIRRCRRRSRHCCCRYRCRCLYGSWRPGPLSSLRLCCTHKDARYVPHYTWDRGQIRFNVWLTTTSG